jgi:hypothetical protein
LEVIQTERARVFEVGSCLVCVCVFTLSRRASYKREKVWTGYTNSYIAHDRIHPQSTIQAYTGYTDYTHSAHYALATHATQTFQMSPNFSQMVLAVAGRVRLRPSIKEETLPLACSKLYPDKRHAAAVTSYVLLPCWDGLHTRSLPAITLETLKAIALVRS